MTTTFYWDACVNLFIDEGKLSIKNYTKTELSEKLTNQQVRIYLLNSLREVADVSIYL